MNKTESLTGSFLIAMPSMPDPRFEKSVILLTSYSKEGATGILINKPYEMIFSCFSRIFVFFLNPAYHKRSYKIKLILVLLGLSVHLRSNTV